MEQLSRETSRMDGRTGRTILLVGARSLSLFFGCEMSMLLLPPQLEPSPPSPPSTPSTKVSGWIIICGQWFAACLWYLLRCAQWLLARWWVRVYLCLWMWRQYQEGQWLIVLLADHGYAWIVWIERPIRVREMLSDVGDSIRQGIQWMVETTVQIVAMDAALHQWIIRTQQQQQQQQPPSSTSSPLMSQSVTDAAEMTWTHVRRELEHQTWMLGTETLVPWAVRELGGWLIAATATATTAAATAAATASLTNG